MVTPESSVSDLGSGGQCLPEGRYVVPSGPTASPASQMARSVIVGRARMKLARVSAFTVGGSTGTGWLEGGMREVGCVDQPCFHPSGVVAPSRICCRFIFTEPQRSGSESPAFAIFQEEQDRVGALPKPHSLDDNRLSPLPRLSNVRMEAWWYRMASQLLVDFVVLRSGRKTTH